MGRSWIGGRGRLLLIICSIISEEGGCREWMERKRGRGEAGQEDFGANEKINTCSQWGGIVQEKTRSNFENVLKRYKRNEGISWKGLCNQCQRGFVNPRAIDSYTAGLIQLT